MCILYVCVCIVYVYIVCVCVCIVYRLYVCMCVCIYGVCVCVCVCVCIVYVHIVCVCVCVLSVYIEDAAGHPAFSRGGLWVGGTKHQTLALLIGRQHLDTVATDNRNLILTHRAEVLEHQHQVLQIKPD